MPYKDKETRMQRQRARRDTPIDTPINSKAKGIDTPAHFDTPEADTPVELIPLVDTPGLTKIQAYEGLSSVFKTPEGLKKLDQIFKAFESSSYPGYMQEVRLGVFGPTLDYVYKMTK